MTTTAAASLAASASTRRPSRVDRDRHDLEPGLLDDQAVAVPARVLERDPLDAAAAQPAADQREALGEAGADEHLLGVGGGAADAAEVLGERLAQPGTPRGSG